MSFMQPQIEEAYAYVVETTQGTWIVPIDVIGHALKRMDKREALAQYVEGEVLSWEQRHGWIARMSAPGYMDATDWSIHATEAEAQAYLDEMYGDDE